PTSSSQVAPPKRVTYQLAGETTGSTSAALAVETPSVRPSAATDTKKSFLVKETESPQLDFGRRRGKTSRSKPEADARNQIVAPHPGGVIFIRAGEIATVECRAVNALQAVADIERNIVRHSPTQTGAHLEGECNFRGIKGRVVAVIRNIGKV